jgi:hypothetical protein
LALQNGAEFWLVTRESALGPYLEASEHVIGGTESTEGFIHSARKRVPFTWTDAGFIQGWTLSVLISIL